MFELLLKFKPRLKFFKLGLRIPSPKLSVCTAVICIRDRTERNGEFFSIESEGVRLCYYITINWLSDREYITVGNSDWKLMLALNLANRWRWLTQDLVCVFECVYVGKPFEMCGERERGELSHNLVDRTQGYWPPGYNHATSS